MIDIKKIKTLAALANNDFHAKYAGNFLGVLWAFLYPCATVVLYWFVFRIALHSEAEDGAPYILWLVSALVPYLFLCDALPGTASVFIDYSYLVKKVKLDIGILPAVRILSNLIIHMFFVLLLLILAFALGYFPRPQNLWLIYYIIAEVIFLSSLGSLLSVLTVFIRDIRVAVNIFIQIGYWLTPIFWSTSSLEPHLALLIKIINPIIYISEGFRAAILSGSAPDMSYTVYFWALTLIILTSAAALLKRLRGVITDYV